MDSEKIGGNELEWIGDVSNDYWDYYDAVVFNKKMSKDEFTKFIDQALKSTQPANASDWGDDDEMSDLEYLNYRIRREGQAFIGKYVEDNGKTVLVYGLDPYELYPQVKDPKVINYEDIKKGLSESNLKTSDNELRNIAKKYETKGEWKNSDENTYQQALGRGKDFYSDITSHMIPGKRGRDVKILTNDELRDIAKKYETKSEWKIKSQSTWKRAKNRDKEIPGFFDDITSHMDVLRKSLSDDELRDIAKKYETRTEWYRKSPNSYRQAIRRDKEIPGFYNDITSDMKRLEVSEKYIYAYEFYDGEKPIAAYIGLTCDMRRRSKEHETGFCRYGKSESTVTRYIKNNPKLKYKIVELESKPLKGEEAKAKEKYWEKVYRERGWETLNVAKAGALGLTYIITNDELRGIAKKYETRNEWKNSIDGNAYRSALRRGKDFYDDITSHMVSGKSRSAGGKFKSRNVTKGEKISESNELGWIEDAYESEWTFSDIAQLYYAGDVDYVKIVEFKDLKHLNGALDWCAGSGDFHNNFKVGNVHQIISTNLGLSGEIRSESETADLDCGWCLDDPDSIGYDCNKKNKTMSLRFKPKDPDFFVFTEDWIKLEPIFISDDLNESSDDLDESFNVGGWCDETRWTCAREEYYEDYEPINGRDKFFGHYKIMEEKVGDFDWVEEISNTLPYDRPWVLVNDIDPESEKVSVEMQNFLFHNQGFKWISGKNNIDHRPFLALSYQPNKGAYTRHKGVGYHDLYHYFDSEGNPKFEERLKRFREDFGMYTYLWSSIKHSQINESKDDFDWVRDTKSNPFYGTDIKFYIDKAPTLEQSKYIWDLLVDADVTTMEKVRKFNRVHKLMYGGGTFIFIDHDGEFMHNVKDLSGYIENGRVSAGNILKFSDIFPDDDLNDLSVSINESSDFGWVGDVPLILRHIFNKLEVGDELTLKGNTYGIHTPGEVKYKYTEPFKITIQSIGTDLEDSFFKISVKEKEAVVNLGIKHKGELLKKYPNSHVFKNNNFFDEDGDLEVVSWVKSKDRDEEPINETEDDLQWIEDTEPIDPKKPKPGYVYHWEGYSDFFGGEDIESDNILIKKSEIDEGKMYYFFDTLDFFWGDNPDAVMKTEFNRRLNDGTITFLYKLI